MRTGPVDPEVLAARLREQTEIDDPQLGPTAPLDAEARSPLWPDTARWQRIELEQITEEGARRLEEYRFIPAVPGDTPATLRDPVHVALMLERSPNGASRARVYGPRDFAASGRRPLPVDIHVLAARTPAAGRGDFAPALYFSALARADVAALTALFEPAGALRPAFGPEAVGREAIRACLETQLRSGPMPVKFCTALRQDPRSAYEVLGAGDRPALVVFEAAPGGALARVRWYA